MGGAGAGSVPQERAQQRVLCSSLAPTQVDVIKKAYLQEEERENSEVSPREVGHNIYILALQVPSAARGPGPVRPRPSAALPSRQRSQLSRPVSCSFPGTTNSCSTC